MTAIRQLVPALPDLKQDWFFLGPDILDNKLNDALCDQILFILTMAKKAITKRWKQREPPTTLEFLSLLFTNMDLEIRIGWHQGGAEWGHGARASHG